MLTHLEISPDQGRAAPFRLKSGLAKTSFGHFRKAIPTGSPVWTPHFLAGMDFARMIPVRFSGSPPIAEGMRRRSSCPSATRRAAS